MATRNDPELSPELVRVLAVGRSENRKLGDQIAQLEAGDDTPSRDFEEKIDTAVKRLSEEARAVIEKASREKMPSYPGNVNVTVELPQATSAAIKHDRSEPPSKGSALSIQVSEHKKLRVTGGLAVVIVAVLVAAVAALWLVLHN